MVSIAAHSELMRVVADEFRAIVDVIALNLPEMPIIANISASPLDTLQSIRAEMEGQLTSSVRWTDTVHWLIEQGVTDFIEIGPKNVLAGLIRRVSKEVNTWSISTPEDIAALLKAEG